VSDASARSVDERADGLEGIVDAMLELIARKAFRMRQETSLDHDAGLASLQFVKYAQT
jgi:hypothetical protein